MLESKLLKMFEVLVGLCNNLRPEHLAYYSKKLGKVNLPTILAGFLPTHKCYGPFVLCKPNKLSGQKPLVRKSHFVDNARFARKNAPSFVQLRKIYKNALMETIL